MDRESVERLRFDRRLQRRRDWLDKGEYKSHTEALPDVTGKMTRIGDEPESSDAGDVVTPTAAAVPEPATDPGGFPTGGSFSGSGGSSTPS